MERNNIASIEGENMICDADHSASTEFNMPDVETVMEEVANQWTLRRKTQSLRLFWYRTAKGITITILGAISQAGVIDISLRKPQAVSISKKRKANDTRAMVVSGRVGTRAEHFLAYMSNVMDVLDRNNMKGH
jgi:hypothetical protein